MAEYRPVTEPLKCSNTNFLKHSFGTAHLNTQLKVFTVTEINMSKCQIKYL